MEQTHHPPDRAIAPDGAPDWLDAGKLADLASHAQRADAELAWPDPSWRIARELGAPGWSIPPEFGGRGLDRVAQLEGSEQVASACLTTAFILSQREAAVRWLVQAGDAIRRRYLPALARGDAFATVGLSQLTTSRQHRPPSLRARALGPPERPTAYRLDGSVPWVTGADHADVVVTGAALEDNRQVLLLLTGEVPGVLADPPLPLAALAGSRTAELRCDGAEVPAGMLVAGPGNQLVRSGGGLDTSCLALGLARAAVTFLLQEGARRPNVRPAAQRLADALRACRQRLHALAQVEPSAEDVLALRVDCTRLALRATQASLAVAKGTGFLLGHPAQRWARQAHFFLVWSCPQPAAEGLLADLADLGG